MCNLSTGIEEKATEKFILNMYKKGYTLDQIADVEETSVAAVEAVIRRKSLQWHRRQVNTKRIRQ